MAPDNTEHHVDRKVSGCSMDGSPLADGQQVIFRISVS
jgi:hypothetical protein